LISADEALRIGLANRVVDDGKALDESLAFARQLAAGPAFAHSMTKQMIEDESSMTLDDAIEAEAQAQAICMMHPDFKEAYEAAVQKRPAKFR
jgi:enoyl-CoA hydratase/carnithine racemase